MRLALDGVVRLLDERAGAIPQPVVAPGLPLVGIHPLLHHRPVAVVGNHKAVQVQIEAVLHGRAVHLGDQPAGPHQGRRIEGNPLTQRQQFVRRAARMPAAATAHVNAQLGRDRRQPALERAQHAGGDPGRMPVHAHHATQGLKPERIGEPTQDLVATVFEHQGFDNHPAKARHARGEPHGDPPAVQRQIGRSCLHLGKNPGRVLSNSRDEFRRAKPDSTHALPGKNPGRVLSNSRDEFRRAKPDSTHALPGKNPG
jgi:hypothetical protein